MATPVVDPLIRALLQNRLPLPNNFPFQLLTAAEFDCYCCPKGVVAGISPQDFQSYQRNYLESAAAAPSSVTSFTQPPPS